MSDVAETVALSEDEFNAIVDGLPEDGFRTIVPLLMESFAKKRGRTLDTTQLASLVVGIMEMSATIESQVGYIGELQKELQECQQKSKSGLSRLWTPPE